MGPQDLGNQAKPWPCPRNSPAAFSWHLGVRKVTPRDENRTRRCAKSHSSQPACDGEHIFLTGLHIEDSRDLLDGRSP